MVEAEPLENSEDRQYTEDLEEKFMDIMTDMGGDLKVEQMDSNLSKFDDI